MSGGEFGLDIVVEVERMGVDTVGIGPDSEVDVQRRSRNLGGHVRYVRNTFTRLPSLVLTLV